MASTAASPKVAPLHVPDAVTAVVAATFLSSNAQLKLPVQITRCVPPSEYVEVNPVLKVDHRPTTNSLLEVKVAVAPLVHAVVFGWSWLCSLSRVPARVPGVYQLNTQLTASTVPSSVQVIPVTVAPATPTHP